MYIYNINYLLHLCINNINANYPTKIIIYIYIYIIIYYILF